VGVPQLERGAQQAGPHLHRAAEQAPLSGNRAISRVACCGAPTSEEEVPVSPLRPRQHVLEELSIRRITAVLPPEWVVRPVASDYGIDLDVEIFEEERPTGQRFYIQAKAVERIQSIPTSHSVTIDHLNYWNRQASPVMIVLYDAATEVMYRRWSISHDPGMVQQNQKSTSVRFTAGETLGKECRSAITSEVEFLTGAHRKHLDLPVEIACKSSSRDISTDDLRSELHSASVDLRLGSILQVADSGQYPAQFEVSPDKISTRLPFGIRSITFHLVNQNETVEVQWICRELIAAFATLLVEFHPSAALDILEKIGFSHLLMNPIAAQKVMPALVDLRRPRLALEIAKSIQEAHPDESHTALAYLTAAMTNLGDLATEEQIEVGASFLIYAQALAPAGTDRAVGALLLNTTHFLHNSPWLRLGFFLAAEAKYPDYGLDPWFMRKVGGCYFVLAQWDASLNYYKRAWDSSDLEGRAEMVVEYSDSLIFAGKFANALQVLNETEATRFRRLAPINLTLVKTVIEKTGLTEQERNSPDVGLEDPVQVLKSFDALDPIAWESLAGQEDADYATKVAAARLDVKNGAKWARAAAALVNAGEEFHSLLDGVLRTVSVDAPTAFKHELRVMSGSRLAREGQQRLLREFASVLGGESKEGHESKYWDGTRFVAEDEQMRGR